MTDNHFADVGKKATMSLTFALIVLNQCNSDGKIKVDRAELKEAVRVVTAAVTL